jgi:hypothetical protein
MFIGSPVGPFVKLFWMLVPCQLLLQAALLVLEAQLCLLLSLAAAGGPSARKGSTKAVADAGALSFLKACKALDYTPEQPSSHQRLKKSGALRLDWIQLPAFCLMLAVTNLLLCWSTMSVNILSCWCLLLSS